MTMRKGGNRHSTSSQRSDLSATVYGPNSSSNSPRSANFEKRSSKSSIAIDSSNDEEQQADDEDPAVEEDEDADLDEDELEYPKVPVKGWPQVAQLMASTPDFAAFSRFRDLNIKSLLYYQAQLTTLRQKLHEQEYDDSLLVEGHETKFAARADVLMDAEESKDCQQFKLIKEIREVLKDYNAALLQFSQVSALPEPDTYNMKSLRKWLRHPGFGDFCIRGNGEQSTWGDLYKDPDAGLPSLWRQFWLVVWAFIWPQPPPENELDLVVTRPQSKIDGFTQWVTWYWIPFTAAYLQYREKKGEEKRVKAQPDPEKNPSTSCLPFHKSHRKRKNKKSKNKPIEAKTKVSKLEKGETIKMWSEKGVLKFTSGVSTVIACLLPVVAITVLSQLHGKRDLLICVASFAIIFAVGLIFLTNGTSTRVEIFTATAAFSAVLVVFISQPVIIGPAGIEVQS
ncbi:hypothetical protein BGZ60DRAFT_115900 [Tricladium varicosporioides]|nr:hypothetical protein BGZ60DRAFT_115900 [Hymenoscyphus varicosporioides]